MTTYKEIPINKFLSVRLERGQTIIYVTGQPFIQCKHLLLDIPVAEINVFEEIESIDEAAEKVEKFMGREMNKSEIFPETEFWGQCSNLQAWYEHEYDTRLLHSNIAFALLNKLAEVGDPLAKKIFKEEVIQRYESGSDKTREYIRSSGILRNFPIDEHLNLILNTDDLIALTEFIEKVWTDREPYEIALALLREEHMKLKNKKVAELDLSGLDLELEDFPKAILNLKNLKVLYLGSSYIREIPEEINKLKSLRELTIRSNEISHLPDSLCEITSLEKLSLDFNRVHVLPENLGKLTNLKSLKLLGNQLQILPESICKLQSLIELKLSSNNLTQLPECIEDLHTLQYLDISRNPLINNPKIIEDLKKLNIKKLELE